LLDITKSLPKSNYGSPLASNKKNFHIKVAKGLPEIFDKPRSRLESERYDIKTEILSQPTVPTPKISSSISIEQKRNEISMILRNKIYNKVMKPRTEEAPKYEYRLPVIQRVAPNATHNYSVNYSCRAISNRGNILR